MSRSQNRRADDAHLGNVFGTLSLVVTDRMRDATEGAAGQRAAGPAALVMLHEFRPGASVEDLRHAVGLTHSGAVRLVDRLVAAGDVERRAADDARAARSSSPPRAAVPPPASEPRRAESVTAPSAPSPPRSAPRSPVCRRRSCAKSCASASPSARRGSSRPTAGSAACATPPPAAAPRATAPPLTPPPAADRPFQHAGRARQGGAPP